MVWIDGRRRKNYTPRLMISSLAFAPVFISCRSLSILEAVDNILLLSHNGSWSVVGGTHLQLSRDKMDKAPKMRTRKSLLFNSGLLIGDSNMQGTCCKPVTQPCNCSEVAGHLEGHSCQRRLEDRIKISRAILFLRLLTTFLVVFTT